VYCSEAARLTGLAVQTLYRWIEAGLVPGERVGGYRLCIHWDKLLKHIGKATCKARFITPELDPEPWAKQGEDPKERERIEAD